VAKLDRLSRDVTFISGLMSLRVPLVVAELHPAGWPWRMCEIALTGIRTQRRDQRPMLPQRRSVLF